MQASVQFDTGEFEKRLAQVNNEFHEELKQSVLYREPDYADLPLNFEIPAAVVAETVRKEQITETPPPSGLRQPRAGGQAKPAEQADARPEQASR